jgi:hypothetical protein
MNAMPFIKFKEPDGKVKLLNADSIREAEFDPKEGILTVFIGNNGGTSYYLHGNEARAALQILENLA